MDIPHNLDLERAVLGALLVDAGAIDEVRDVLAERKEVQHGRRAEAEDPWRSQPAFGAARSRRLGVDPSFSVLRRPQPAEDDAVPAEALGFVRQVGAGLPVAHPGMCWQLVRDPYDGNAILAAFGDVARGHTAGPPGEGDIYRSRDRGDSWERIGRQKRGSKFLGLPAIRVLWAAAEG